MCFLECIWSPPRLLGLLLMVGSWKPMADIWKPLHLSDGLEDLCREDVLVSRFSHRRLNACSRGS